MPEDFKLDLTEPWQLQLLVQRSVGARDKAFLTFDLGYTLPDHIPARSSSRRSAAPAAAAPAAAPSRRAAAVRR